MMRDLGQVDRRLGEINSLVLCKQPHKISVVTAGVTDRPAIRRTIMRCRLLTIVAVLDRLDTSSGCLLPLDLRAWVVALLAYLGP